MRRTKLIRISLYTLLACIVVAAAGAGLLWYKLENKIHAMYEPLPSKEWSHPVFEEENAQEDASAGQSNVVEEKGATNALAAGGQVEGKDVASATTTGDGKLTDEEVDRLLHPNLDRKDPFCILLLGVDERPWDRGRSDTMILLSIQPAKHSALAISIPRDTRVLIPKRETYDKINHAYAFGGTSLSVSAVERLFGVPIAYYMKTNMEGIVDIVDTVGGVDVDNARRFTYEGVSFPKGEQHLDGTNALLYVRMRKEDPNGDFGRTERQRQLLSAIIDRVVSFRSLGKLPHILSKLSEDVRTNLTSGDLFDLATEYKSEIKRIDTLYLNGTGRMIGGIYYYTVQPEDRAAIRDQLLAHLEGT
ncbi:MAG: LCP family protein [Cohnella sp.]|nr:LCP family protein [Cohnella sp.]